VVGESGSGKSTLGLAVGRLLAANAVHVGGDLRILGDSVFARGAEQLRQLRREVLGFIFQDPVASLNPTLRIQRQMELATDAKTHELVASLDGVGITDAQRVLRAYPHELSGGMAQRVAIATALLRKPRLLVADEPTAAVDATRRAQILELLAMRCSETGCALLLLTHDLHSVARWCTSIAVMYGGRIVESGPANDVLAHPRHPYTVALVSALPGDERPGERLQAIPGRPPVLTGRSEGCAFAPRCPAVLDYCARVRPTYMAMRDRHICCHLFEEGDPEQRHLEGQRGSPGQRMNGNGNAGEFGSAVSRSINSDAGIRGVGPSK
jgi:oligopeptide/dipeptide ABC transporter ATP-binding protein